MALATRSARLQFEGGWQRTHKAHLERNVKFKVAIFIFAPGVDTKPVSSTPVPFPFSSFLVWLVVAGVVLKIFFF